MSLRKILEELNLKTKEAYKYRIDNKDDRLHFTYDDKSYIDLIHQQILALLPSKTIYIPLRQNQPNDKINYARVDGRNEAIDKMKQNLTKEE